ncbi:MAG: hypothetical protein ACP5SH_17665, partial [Syntrophobacteraceae bacterium]
MINLNQIRIGPMPFQAIILFLALLVFPTFALAQGYDGFVAMLVNPNPSVNDLIQRIKSVRLFPGPLSQLVLNVYGQGSNVRQWGDDIYRWDGRAMREVWRWVRKSVESSWPVQPNGETTGEVTRSQISLRESAPGMAKEIITSSEVDEGVFSDEKGREWQLKMVTSRHESQETHRWDESLYYYVTKRGRILPAKITVRCRQKGSGEKSETLHTGMKGEHYPFITTPDYSIKRAG